MKKLCMLLLVFFLMPCVAFAGEINGSFNYLRETDEVTSDISVVHTLYVGMPVSDFKENFTNLEGWKITENGYSEPGIGENNGVQYKVYRNFGVSNNIYEIILVDTDGEHINGITIDFYTNSESIARLVYAQAKRNNTSLAGEPRRSYQADGRTVVANWFKRNTYSLSVVKRQLLDEEVAMVKNDLSLPSEVRYRIMIMRD